MTSTKTWKEGQRKSASQHMSSKLVNMKIVNHYFGGAPNYWNIVKKVKDTVDCEVNF